MPFLKRVMNYSFLKLLLHTFRLFFPLKFSLRTTINLASGGALSKQDGYHEISGMKFRRYDDDSILRAVFFYPGLQFFVDCEVSLKIEQRSHGSLREKIRKDVDLYQKDT